MSWKLGLASGSCIANIRKQGCDFLEELLNIVSGLGTNFFEEHFVLFCQLLALAGGYLSLLKVDFVSKESDNYSVSSLIFNVVDPFLYAFEGIGVGHIIDDDCD